MRLSRLVKLPIGFVGRILSSPDPWDVRMLEVVDNLLARLETRQGCCGHYGEPGC